VTPLSRELTDALHADGYHVVTRQEWYAQQARIAVLEKVEEAARNMVASTRSDTIFGSHSYIYWSRKLIDALETLDK